MQIKVKSGKIKKIKISHKFNFQKMKTSHKKITATSLIIGLLMLSGCGSSTPTTATVSNQKYKTYETQYIQTSYPQDWDLIEEKDFPQGTPNSTIVIFKSNIKNELFLTNVNIAHSTLPSEIDSIDYGKQVIANQKALLQNYNELSRNEIEIPISGQNQKVTFVTFEGKRSATDPVIKFSQLYAVKGTQAYILTGAMLPTEEASVQASAEDIVKSLKVK
ncbi:MAG: hypothetical protein US89_C0004G0122 [Candidatus Peregrinibacteria bacterium GW2011_GWF2_38_29]|nr:MAG: hypothetical protein US89_C0004G0122 [Candidatus Peregrinibacteria bacterium GW2011_GWF2_38_29]